MIKLPIAGKYVTWAKAAVVIFTTVGLVGMIVAPGLFAPLSPFNLLLNAVLLGLFVQEWSPHMIRFTVMTVAVGIAIEILGVRTGVIFGEYHYGDALGFKMGEVPVLIGVNWWILTICAMDIAARFTSNFGARVVLGALLMTGLDMLIEPVAPKLDFWYWVEDVAPLRNYVGWLLVSSFLHMVGRVLQLNSKNALAPWVMISQAVFFIGLNIWFWFHV